MEVTVTGGGVRVVTTPSPSLCGERVHGDDQNAHELPDSEIITEKLTEKTQAPEAPD